jgi:hypothetical protein
MECTANPGKEKKCKFCSKSEGNSCILNSSIPYVFPGYWVVTRSDSNIFQCIPSSSCNQTGVEEKTICAVGYTGKRCGQCVYPEYFHFDSICKKCGDKSISIGAVIVLIFLLILFVLNSFLNDGGTHAKIELGTVVMSLQLLALYPRLTSSLPPRAQNLMNSLGITVSFLHFSSVH